MSISHFDNCDFCQKQSGNSKVLESVGYSTPKDFLIETIKQYQAYDQHNIFSAIKLLSADLVEIISNKELEELHEQKEKVQQVS